jgi:hypothetical protein
MKAIETFYRGYRFRSRLEARWAVFFDALRIRWRYEHEGFLLSDGTMYLPDFDIVTKAGRRLFEIKSDVGDSTKASKCAADIACLRFDDHQDEHKSGLAYQYCGIQTLRGDPVDVVGRVNWMMCPRCLRIGEPECGWNEWMDAIGCETCDFTTPDGGGHPHEPGTSPLVNVEPYKGHLIIHPGEAYWRELVESAAIKARQARFEHGECGAMV